MFLFCIPGLLLTACGSNADRHTAADKPVTTEGLTLLWSPDGEWIVFPAATDGHVPELYAIAVDHAQEDSGRNEWVHLSQGFSDVIPPSGLNALTYLLLAWSPDGERIAFTAGDTVYTFNASCLNEPAACVNSLQPMIGGASGWLTLEWSPDSTLLLLESTTAGPMVKTEKGILADDFQFIMRVVIADGSQDVVFTRETELRQAPDWVEHPPFSPAWSPDGEQIIYCSGKDGKSDLYILALDGEKVSQLTHTSNMQEYSPGWSPDGGEILYGVDSNGQHDIYRQDLVGGEPLCVTCNVRPSWQHSLFWPTWSPDGMHIAYAISGRPALFQSALPIYIYVIEPDGSDQIPVVEKGFPGPPFWSPDGTRLAFAFRSKNPLESIESDIFMINADGSDLKHLTD
jgi:Tol biopolymer transport system component